MRKPFVGQLERDGPERNNSYLYGGSRERREAGTSFFPAVKYVGWKCYRSSFIFKGHLPVKSVLLAS